MFDLLPTDILREVWKYCDDTTRVSLILSCKSWYTLYGDKLNLLKPVTIKFNLVGNCGNQLFSRNLEFYRTSPLWKSIFDTRGFEESWFTGKRGRQSTIICRNYAVNGIKNILSYLRCVNMNSFTVLCNNPLPHNSIKIFTLFICNQIVPQHTSFIADFKRFNTVYLCFNEREDHEDIEYHYVNTFDRFSKNWKKKGIQNIVDKLLDDIRASEENTFDGIYYHTKEKRRQRIIVNRKYKN